MAVSFRRLASSRLSLLRQSKDFTYTPIALHCCDYFHPSCHDADAVSLHIVIRNRPLSILTTRDKQLNARALSKDASLSRLNPRALLQPVIGSCVEDRLELGGW